MAKILLVEDDKSLREIYGVRLLAEGYDIVSAGDGEEALAMAIKERPHLIVSDVMMPKISGFDMLDILRSTTETKDIKVIMMTALSSEDQRQRGEELGADRYLVKSQVGIEDVVRTVHEVLEDAPINTQQNVFGSNVPSAVPRPAPSVVPERAPAPQSVASVQATPSAPVQPPVLSQPTAPIPPIVTQPEPAPAAPQTTAPPQQFQPTAATDSFAPQQPVTSVPPAPSAFATSPAPQQPEPQVQESGLPQPTAPFSTPRPAGLADRIIQPLERPAETGRPLNEMMAQELGTPHQEPTAPPAPQPENHGISFEETPRSPQSY